MTVEITIQVPEALSEQVQRFRERLPEILERSEQIIRIQRPGRRLAPRIYHDSDGDPLHAVPRAVQVSGGERRPGGDEKALHIRLEESDGGVAAASLCLVLCNPGFLPGARQSLHKQILALLESPDAEDPAQDAEKGRKLAIVSTLPPEEVRKELDSLSESFGDNLLSGSGEGKLRRIEEFAERYDIADLGKIVFIDDAWPNLLPVAEQSSVRAIGFRGSGMYPETRGICLARRIPFAETVSDLEILLGKLQGE